MGDLAPSAAIGLDEFMRRRICSGIGGRQIIVTGNRNIALYDIGIIYLLPAQGAPNNARTRESDVRRRLSFEITT
jgi:hypothetical protein